jgi:hypothetical protein
LSNPSARELLGQDFTSLRITLCETMVPHSRFVQSQDKCVRLAHVAASELHLASTCIGPQQPTGLLACTCYIVIPVTGMFYISKHGAIQHILVTHRVRMIRMV